MKTLVLSEMSTPLIGVFIRCLSIYMVSPSLMRYRGKRSGKTKASWDKWQFMHGATTWTMQQHDNNEQLWSDGSKVALRRKLHNSIPCIANTKVTHCVSPLQHTNLKLLIDTTSSSPGCTRVHSSRSPSDFVHAVSVTASPLSLYSCPCFLLSILQISRAKIRKIGGVALCSWDVNWSARIW